MSYKDLFRDGVKATLSLGMNTEGFVPYWLTQQEFDELYQEWLDDKEAERLKHEKELELLKTLLPKPEEAINYKPDN